MGGNNKNDSVAPPEKVSIQVNVMENTEMCLSIGTPKKINCHCLSIGIPKNNKFSICSKWKFNYFLCPKIWAHYNLVIMCLNIVIPKSLHFSFWDKWKSFGVRCPNTEVL